jgi:curved DNA-binding protein
MTGPTAGSQEPDLDLYQVLGVEPGAGSAQLARAYRRLARRYHPDVNTTPEAAKRFSQITHAYRVLSDPHSRNRYDAKRAGRRAANLKWAGGPRLGWWSAATPQPAGPSAATREAFWIGGPSLAHAFHLGTDDAPGRSTDHEEAEVDVSVEEAYRGTSRTVTITSHDRSDTVQVVIPPGVITGDCIAVPTTHLPGGRDNRAVFLRVRLLPHERFRVDGRDVHVRLPLSPWEAALGVTVPVDSLDGPATIEVPAGTSSGQALALPGHGVPNPAGPAGVLYAHVTIVLPPQLTSAERALFRQLATTSTFHPRRTAAPQR